MGMENPESHDGTLVLRALQVTTNEFRDFIKQDGALFRRRVGQFCGSGKSFIGHGGLHKHASFFIRRHYDESPNLLSSKKNAVISLRYINARKLMILEGIMENRN